VIVNGLVEGAKIRAGGSIRIQGGIQGGGKAELKATENILARFASEAALEAGVEIILQTHLMNCRASAGENVIVKRRRGVIAGGEVRAGKKIESFFLGTDLGVKTVLQIGLDDDLSQKISDKEEEIEGHTKLLAGIQEILLRLNEVKEEKGALNDEQEKVRVRAVRDQFQIMGRLETLNIELLLLLRERERNRKGTVTATDCAFPGVVVKFPGKSTQVGHAMRHLSFYFDEGEIRTRAI